MRRAFFARGNDAAARYGIRYEQVVEHFGPALRRAFRPPAPQVYLDDVVHATACLEGNELAWRDLLERHERALVRACREWIEPGDAVLFVRRLLWELRGDPPGVLRRFDGTCSLRRWLGDQLFAALRRAGAIGDGPAGAPPPRPERRDGTAAPVRPLGERAAPD